MSEHDTAQHREVLGHFVTGVVVITGATPEGPAGFTCQTFGSLSVDEALAFFSASVVSKSWARLRVIGVVGVNILRADQEQLARSFGVTGPEKFDGVTWRPGPQGSPFLEGAIAHLEGTVFRVTNHGDHDIVVVKLDHLEAHGGDPLAYFRGAYRQLT